MTQRSFFWDGVSVGDANGWVVATADGVGYHMSNPYVVSPWVDIVMRSILNGDDNRGVLSGWLNELAVTGAASPLAVDTGGAVLYGLAYESDAALSISVPTPTSDTRIDRIIVRRDWSTRETRVVRLAGTEGGPAPALTQTLLNRWEIPLYQASIDIAGTITLTDEREYCTYATRPVAGSIATAHLVNDSADLTARSTRTKKFFVPAQALQPESGTGYTPWGTTYYPAFQYAAGGSYLSNRTLAPWDGNLPPGWTGDSTSYYTGWYAGFKVPPLMSGSALTINAWWTAAGSPTFYLRSAWQMWRTGESVQYSEGYSSTYCNSGGGAGRPWNKTLVRSVSPLYGDEWVNYFLATYSAAAAEDVLIHGLEIQYTGYVP